MFKRIAHVCLHVHDLARSVEFFEELGLTTKFRFTRDGAPFGAYLELADGNYLELFEQPPEGAPGSGGLAHFCLEAEDLDQVVATLSARGVAFTEKKLGCDQTYQIWLTDPDGNRFEVHQYTSASMQRLGGVVEADW